ncbi:MAG: PLDc N-terminal domain-containing protein [Alphaproteobacteria bacterium]|nr:PLDc N-terminal domain-containing protein [Alphaproteobacteria bacterium]
MDTLDLNLLLMLSPLILLDVGMKVLSLVQLSRADAVAFDSKPLWVAIILLVSPFGWIAWMLAGRPRA